MVEIRAGALREMSSPIRHVMRHIHKVFVIAPERKKEFDKKKLDDFTLEYLDDHKWICSVDVDKKYIWLSRKVVEVIWASSLTYYSLYLAMQDKSVEINLRSDPKLSQPCDLFSWALESWLNKDESGWPDGLPCPIKTPDPESDLNLVDELALYAVAYLLHHELAHIQLNHTKGADIEAEREADMFSAEWIFGGLDPSQSDEKKKFTKRGLGVAVALNILVAHDIHAGDFGGHTHPRSFDRLMNVLKEHVTDHNDMIWDFVVSIISFHFDNADHGAGIPEGPFETFLECVDAHVDALSRIA